MRIFRLDPISDRSNDPAWAATELHENCWVLARDVAHARLLVEMATLRMVDGVPGEKKLRSPWSDPKLTECEPDDPDMEVLEGIVLAVGGRRFKYAK